MHYDYMYHIHPKKFTVHLLAHIIARSDRFLAGLEYQIELRNF